MLDESGLIDHLPPEKKIYLDSAYEGVDKEHGHLTLVRPKKKPKGKKLNGGEKMRNKKISSIRVKVEHAIGLGKRYRIISSKYRNKIQKLNSHARLAYGLCNLRIHHNLINQQNYAEAA